MNCHHTFDITTNFSKQIYENIYKIKIKRFKTKFDDFNVKCVNFNTNIPSLQAKRESCRETYDHFKANSGY